MINEIIKIKKVTTNINLQAVKWNEPIWQSTFHSFMSWRQYDNMTCQDTLWRDDVSVCYQLLLLCDSDEGLWQLDRESLWWSDDGVRTGLPVTWPVIRALTWLLSSYLGDYFTARHYCCYYRQEIWVKIVTKPPPLGPASGYLIIQQSLRSAAPWLNVIINTLFDSNEKYHSRNLFTTDNTNHST